jgi:molybdenum cofactor cytidylyltransferase
MSDVCALVLAAGEGRRFDPTGDAWKLAAPLPDGRPVLRAACEALVGVVDEIVVVCGTRCDLAAAILEGLPVRLLACPDARRGMGASLRRGVSETGPALGWLVALGDMPFVSPATHAAVRDRLQAGAAIARPVFEGRPGHPVAFSAGQRSALLAIGDEAGAARLLRDRADLVETVACDDPGCVADVDRPSDIPAATPAASPNRAQ